MKFCVQILGFDNKDFFHQCLDNCGPHFDKIFIGYSKVPFAYIPEARKTITNSLSKEFILESKFVEKIELIEDIWDYEEEMRNRCLDEAKKQGFDYMFIIDPDEFYQAESFSENQRYIEEHPDFDFYYTYWINFWKNRDYILIDANGGYEQVSPTVVVNLKTSTKFLSRRSTNGTRSAQLPKNMYHLAYVRTNEEMHRKCNTQSHSNDFLKDFYNIKWLKWNVATKNLHPTNATAWRYARKHNLELPAEMLKVEKYPIEEYKNSLLEALTLRYIYLKDFKQALSTKIKTTIINFLRSK